MDAGPPPWGAGSPSIQQKQKGGRKMAERWPAQSRVWSQQRSPIARSGRFPVRWHERRLSGIMDYQDERPPDGRTYDAQLHRNIRGHRHGFAGPSLLCPCLSLQALLAGKHVPGFGSRMGVHMRTITGSHDGVGKNSVVGLRWRELQGADHTDDFATSRSSIPRPKFGKPYSPILFNNNSFCTLDGLGGGPAWKGSQMPVQRWLTELKPSCFRDDEAPKLRPLLTWQHFEASDN